MAHPLEPIFDPDDVSTWPRCPRCGTFPATSDPAATGQPRRVLPHLSALPNERGQSCAAGGVLAVFR